MLISALAMTLLLGAKPLPVNDPLAKLVNVPGMERWKQLLTEVEPKQLWKQIHWVSVEEALKQAKESRKPILVAIKTGAGGRPKAPST
jgi:hypothetical protein